MKQVSPEVSSNSYSPGTNIWWKDPFVLGFGILFGIAFWISAAISTGWFSSLLYALGIVTTATIILLLSRRWTPPAMEITHPSLEAWVSMGWYGVFFLLSMLTKGEGILSGEPGKWIWFVSIPILLLIVVRGRPIDWRAILRSIGLHRNGLGKAILLALLAYALMIPFIVPAMPAAQLKELQAVFQHPLKAAITIPLSIALSFLTAGFTEEVFFRGIIQARLAKVSGSELRGCLLAAFLFGIYHLPYAYFLTSWPTHGNLAWALASVLTEQMMAGVLLGILWTRTHNLFAPILFHTLVNTLVIMTMLN